MIDRFGQSEPYLVGEGSYREGYSQADWMDQVEENRTGYCTLSLARNPQSTRHLAMTDGQLAKNSTPDSIYCPPLFDLGR